MGGSKDLKRKGFRVSARTILQLGGELISSDGIAFYELIKNAFDAGSPEVRIEVISRLPLDVVEKASRQLLEISTSTADTRAVAKVMQGLESQVIAGAPGAPEYVTALREATAYGPATSLLDEANTIRFEDSGHGMSLEELDSVYLLVGTPARLIERRSDENRVILGEKGIGRLAVMRLGHKLHVRTTRAGELRWNQLLIDWRDFEKDLNHLVEDIHVEPEPGEKKEVAATCGTAILISALKSNWTEEKLRHIAATDLSRAIDPFAVKPRYPMKLRFNGTPVRIDQLDDLLFQRAHAVVTAQMKVRGEAGPILKGQIDYRHYKREQEFRLEKNDLYEAADGVSPHVLDRLGPFTLRFYWFNRKYLDPIEGIGTATQVRKLISQWSGGLMVYRDGFRVSPYGSPDDDWLDLDRTALAWKSYKVNRAQLIGKVDISSRSNPHLIDQTNREGLIDCPEKDALVDLLRHVLIRQFRSFLDQVDEEERLGEPPTLKEVEERFDHQEAQLRHNVTLLRRLAADLPDSGLPQIADRFAQQARQLRKLIRDASQVHENVERRQGRLLDLAGLGLMVEILVHELNRSVIHSLKGLAMAASSSEDRRLVSLLRSAESQLKSLQKRVSVLDRMSTAGRQRSQAFDPEDVVREVFEGRAEQFGRHGIRASLEKTPPRSRLTIKMVKGMFYQIIENLIENSVYWIKSERNLNPGFHPLIAVRIDEKSRALFFSDNGPGIDPINMERVFLPFFSLKKKGQGKGLGLYISREYARDQGLDLTLSQESDRTDGRLNTFILNLAGVSKD